MPKLDNIAPPPKRRPGAAPAKFTGQAEGATAQLNVVLDAERVAWVRVHAAKTGRKPRDVIAEAIDQLREREGD